MDRVIERLSACATVDALMDLHASERPEQVALQSSDVKITFGQLRQRADRLAAQFATEGLKAGDRVAILAKNDPAFCELMMAASRMGIVLVPLNFRLAQAEIEFILQDSGTRMLFAGADFISAALEASANCETCEAVMAVTGDGRYGGWVKALADNVPRSQSADTILFQMYTSGTTGSPKGALISQANVLALMANGCRYLGPFEEDTKSLVCMPLFHVAGNAWLFFGLAAGCCSDLVTDIEPVAILDRIVQNKISCTLMVPTVIQMLTAAAEARGEVIRGLKSIAFGASPMPAELLKRARKVFPDTDFVHVYGMTETTCMFVGLDPAELRANRRLESCGKPFADAEVKVVNPDGAEAAVDEVGEIICKTPQMMQGYWRRPEATANAIRDGWYYTGDAGYLDGEGFLFVRDRIKDMLITGGENVYPAEVENAVLAHQGIADVAVIGIHDETWGEAVLAAVVLKEGATVQDDEIKAVVRERLAGFKVPKRIERVSALPRNGAGKVTKDAIRQRFSS